VDSIADEFADILPEGLSWAGLFHIRNYIAMKFYQRWDHAIPMTEFQSAGNQALAEVLADPDRPPDRGPFLGWVRHRMHQRMWQVAGQEYGTDWRTGKALRPVPTLALDLGRLTASRPPAAFAHAYLREVCAYLAAYPYPARLESFWRAVAGERPAAIAEALGLSVEAVQQRIRKVRRDLWAWAEDTTARAQRNPSKLTPAHQRRVRELRQQGLPIRQIGRVIGRSQATVLAVLHQTGYYATAAAD
jgi:DNA-directed RNA polymerase specialized sigma24 family protein